ERQIVLFFMVTLLAAGLYSFYSLGRNEDPAFTFRTMVVQAGWPGATLEETTLQVTERLERKLQETPYLDFLNSYTIAGRTTIFVNLRGDTPPVEVPEAWYQVRKKVGDIRHTLPAGIAGPFFDDDFGDTYGIIYGFVADGFSEREMRDKVEDIRSELLLIPDVSKIEIMGAQDEQIVVEFRPETLAGLGLDPATLIAALEAQNVVRPAGVLRTDTEAVTLRVSGAFLTEADILAVNFTAAGRLLRLGDIAEVRRISVDPPQPMFRVDGKSAIGLAIAMRDGGDILILGRNIKAAMAEITANLPVGIEPHLVADQAVIVDEAIGEFTDSLWQAIAIILFISFISLGVRAGAVVACAIPLTLAFVFPILQMIDIDLQRISLGALIIALGLLVDDAMTAVDAMLRRLSAGDDINAAASFAYTTLAFPMLTGSFITMAGFVPIGFARSSAGEYTFSIFAVVSIALVLSWVVAVIFTPLVGAALLRPPKETAAAGPRGSERLYQRLLHGALAAPWLTIAAALVAFALSLAALDRVPRQFFPPSDRVELVVDLRLPQNASIFATEATVGRFDAILGQDPDVERWSSYVGRGAIRFYLPLDVQLANPFFGQVVLVAKDVAARKRLEERLSKVLEEQFPEVVSRIAPLELGPPVGWPVQYRVSGPETGEVRAIAMRLAAEMASNPDVRDVNFNWMEPARELQIRIDQDEVRRLGLSSKAVADLLGTTVTGQSVTQVRDDIYLVEVVARATGGQAMSVASLRNLPVALPDGRTVPLSQFATFEYSQDLPLIWRRDRVPTLTVQSEAAPGALAEEIVDALEPKIAALNAELPKGYHIALGGIAEESANSRASVMAVLPLMVFLTLALLMIQLKTFKRTLLVLAIVPLGLIGVVGALLLFGRPLGFVAILGILSLIGVIARNGVILIEQIEVERRAGQPVRAAVIAACLSRFRPIMLTAVSTVLGLIPIAFTVFWGPMAFAVMGGLMVASVLTLIVLPVLYVLWCEGEDARDPAPSRAQSADLAAAAK
ncbi:MAG: efflux RND transporter permease subunit, partial [Rhodospirillales bacterium]|nr:efflux RND transporter permease subunit [Rhodospirillales bacterium]